MANDPTIQTNGSIIQAISPKDLRASLRNVILGICFGTVFFTVTTGPALTGFARKLGANDFVFGLLMALPVLGGVVQVFASLLLERTGRRKPLFITFLYPQRLVWILIALIPVVFPEAMKSGRIWTAIALIFFSNLCGSVGNVAFMSWMSDLVPKEIRGRFFGRRSAISTMIAIVASFSIGRFLDLYTDFTGYIIVFIVAAMFGAADIACFHWVKEPPMDRSFGPPKLRQLVLEPFRSPSFRRFVVFWCSAMFSILTIGPFLTVYLLEILHLGFGQVSLYTQVIPNIAIFVAAKKWGAMIDRFGCKPVLTVAMTVQSFLPFLWFFSAANRWWLMVLINLLGGFFWSGLDLGSLNMLMKATPDRNRSAYVANFSLLTGVIGNALSYVLAGAFLSKIGPVVAELNMTVLGSPVTRYHVLFLLSGALRTIVLLTALPRLEEPGARSAGDMIKALLYMGETMRGFTGRISRISSIPLRRR